jgi:hypothetical protein
MAKKDANFNLVTNVAGRVDNMPLRKDKDVYWPIFEAISNSFDAIEENGGGPTRITIRIIRDESQVELVDTPKDKRVDSVLIEDNGCGFTENNFQSFRELDSVKKRSWGGKGVGRLYWLKTFDQVEIDSIFVDDMNEKKRRMLLFKLPSGPQDVNVSSVLQTSEVGTKIKLCGYKKEYEEPFRKKRLATLKNDILKHFMANLILQNDFEIKLFDGDESEYITVNDIPAVGKTVFSIQNQDFAVHHMRVSSVEPEGHFIYYCAGKRAVGMPEKVDSRLGLPKKVQAFGTKLANLESPEKSFYYMGFVTSKFLDKNVNVERTRFAIEDSTPGDGMLDETVITFAHIKAEVNNAIKDFLSQELADLQAGKDARIDEVFSSELPGFEYLRHQSPQLFQNLSVDATPDDIKETVAKAHFKNRAQTQKNITDLIERVAEDQEDANDFERECLTNLPQLLEVHRADLAQHVQFRAYVLRLLNKILSKNSNDKHYKEKTLHSLIFPMRVDERKKNKDDFSVHKHQLWLFDERFSFYDYVASDKELKSHKGLENSENGDRPDVCTYLFSEDITHTPFNSVVIVELKRPGRDGHEEDPVKQVFRYIDEINQKIKDYRGQEVHINKDSTQFYCYVVCDTQTKFIQEEVVVDHEMIPIRGGGGYFMYHSKRRAYIELLSPKAVLRSAYERNLSFFRHLGLQDSVLKL